ncbi:NifB/NifX family molybdenum-iron cluster-binding protein [Desulfobaculum bizertense]|uniref:Predicted Fe-Mo cluster-binding protein, NifX family n=1 Tax=Desulfobaculum bizertense DSM 18034 TaxID=1121442 RepID=A0A1T4WAZ4_9BACT|nr:NifB/NifX family molybdenum-iron cluster-binding protein [Desulfobaculum bizertense]SKA74367.1 Predicted Fe-Mo cluster-binding protein, NifX family [Desulfobaculum bizertense DSM 18034]
MKLALPTKTVDGKAVVDSHFGHCEYFTVVCVDDATRTETSRVRVEAPEGCGCKSNVAELLAADGVTVMLAGNMGQGAVDRLAGVGIEVLRGCEGELDQIISDWLAGKVVDNAEICDHHDEDGHSCHHEHEAPGLKPLS